jgi:hypothetical protein
MALIILTSKRYTNWELSVQGSPLWGQGYKFTKLLREDQVNERGTSKELHFKTCKSLGKENMVMGPDGTQNQYLPCNSVVVNFNLTLLNENQTMALRDM